LISSLTDSLSGAVFSCAVTTSILSRPQRAIVKVQECGEVVAAGAETASARKNVKLLVFVTPDGLLQGVPTLDAAAASILDHPSVAVHRMSLALWSVSLLTGGALDPCAAIDGADTLTDLASLFKRAGECEETLSVVVADPTRPSKVRYQVHEWGPALSCCASRLIVPLESGLARLRETNGKAWSFAVQMPCRPDERADWSVFLPLFLLCIAAG
jgi:hypothetical protein